jgi:hypothetical protein
LHKILSATAEVKSHNKAAQVLGVLCELPISGRHVNRLAEEVGLEMAAQRDQATEERACMSKAGRKTRLLAC